MQLAPWGPMWILGFDTNTIFQILAITIISIHILPTVQYITIMACQGAIINNILTNAQWACLFFVTGTFFYFLLLHPNNKQYVEKCPMGMFILCDFCHWHLFLLFAFATCFYPFSTFATVNLPRISESINQPCKKNLHHK